MRKLLKIIWVFVFTAGGFFSCFAGQVDEPKAHVLPSRLQNGERIAFSWDEGKKVPFSTEVRGNKVVLHFARPVSLIWGRSLVDPSSPIRQVETEKNGSTVILTLASPRQTRDFLSYGKNGIDLLGGGKSALPVSTMSTIPVHHPKKSLAAAKKAKANSSIAKSTREATVKQAVLVTPAPSAPSEAAAPVPSTVAETTTVPQIPVPALPPATVQVTAENQPAITIQSTAELAQLSPSAGKIPAPTDAPAALAPPHTAAPAETSAVTSPEVNAVSTAENAAPAAANTLFPYARWKISDEKELIPTEEKLFHDIAYGTMESANKARLQLLGIYLSEGLFPEARGMADDILRSSLKFYVVNKVAALRAASYFFMYRIGDAEHDFSAPELANNPEAKLWVTLCKELLGEERGTDTFSFLSNYDRYIQHYPPVFIQKLAIISADLSINRKEYDTAIGIFDILKRDAIEEPVKKYVDYMRAKVYSETKNEEEAAKIWGQQAKDYDDPLIRARAEFSLINMLLREDKIDREEAIKRLDLLRIVWRGDSLELNILTLLGNLYAEDNQYDKALHSLRDIVLYYPEVPEAVTAAKKMEEIFVNLYNKGAAKNMPPLEALSLFYEFRDLVPIGKEGDQMIRNLADRLVDIDLLDRAEALLDHQIRKRLDGEERSRVGARLSLIYLMNRQPKEALETLKTTGYGDLPADLQLTRLHLTAQALAQQGQATKAIEVLSSDNSLAGTALRLSIYWDNKDWPNVISTAEEILSNRNDPSAALSPQETDVLLKLATAYVYEHDTGQIQYLRDYFTPLLKKSASKDGFLFITSESGSIDYENLANLNQDITEVKSFLDTYRDQVKKNGLSKAIN
jgi:tetratricopeptide (TPR) repeat protein